MKTFTTTVEIAATPEQIWPVLADVDHWPEWSASVSRIERVDESPLGLNARVCIEQPKLRPAVWTVTSWEPPRRFTWVSRHPGVTVYADHRLEALPAGCRVTLAVQFEGLLGALFARLAGSVTRQYMEMEAAGLKRRSENRA